MSQQRTPMGSRVPLRGSSRRRAGNMRGMSASMLSRSDGSLALDPAFRRWLRRRLLGWYRREARRWPWRRTHDSYHVWVAEVMLQQTRVEVVGKAFPRFVARFPSLGALASAQLEEVLAAWSGLGYYARARNLHSAAQWLWQRGYHGFPRDLPIARKLPGVGAYTAAAVLSIAYNQPLPAVDANVRRVLGRVLGSGLEKARDIDWEAIAEKLLDHRAPGESNQALMELGQQLCTPRAPRCRACPWQTRCPSATAPVAESRVPHLQRRKPVTRIDLAAELVFDRQGRVVVERGVFPYLRHLWLPILRQCAGSSSANGESLGYFIGKFRHAIVRRQFQVTVFARSVSAKEADRLLRRVPRDGERRLVTQDELEKLGRSSLLLKSLALWHKWAQLHGVEFGAALQ